MLRSNKFYVDEIYEWLVARPTRADRNHLRLRGRLFRGRPGEVDRQASAAGWAGASARNQNGLIQFYAGASVLCVAVLLLALMFFSP